MAGGAEGSTGVGCCRGDSHGLAQPFQISIAVGEGFGLVFQLLSVPWNMISDQLPFGGSTLVTQGASAASVSAVCCYSHWVMGASPGREQLLGQMDREGPTGEAPHHAESLQSSSWIRMPLPE